MRNTKAKDLRDKSVAELEEMLLNDQAELFRNRRDLVFRRLTDTTGLAVRRHNIARIMTVLTEKKKGASA